MIKLILFLILVSGAPSVFANTPLGVRPGKLNCNVIGAPEGVLEKFGLSEFNSLKPNSNIPDAVLLDPISEKKLRETGVLGVAFSNECDNFYQIKFLEQNLVDLKNKTISEVTGTLEGFAAETATETAADNQFRLTIRCNSPE